MMCTLSIVFEFDFFLLHNNSYFNNNNNWARRQATVAAANNDGQSADTDEPQKKMSEYRIYNI